MLDLYKNIRVRRKELGMSQEELARKVGYTNRSTVARVEKGEIDISHDKIEAFAKALKTTPFELMGQSGYEDYDIDWVRTVPELSDDPELFLIIERASKDNNFRNKLLQIVDLMEIDK